MCDWSSDVCSSDLPKDIINKLSSVMMEALKDKPVQDQLKKSGIPGLPMTADQMSKRVADDSKWISELMTELGMTKK